MNLLSYLISLASYVLYSLGLYTIAKRRGIRNAWLAWIPVATVWILGSVADDYIVRTNGGKSNMRTWMVVLSIVLIVLLVAVMVCAVCSLANVLTIDELTEFYMSAAGVQDDLYAVSQEEMITQISENMEARMNEEAAQNMLTAALVMLGCCLPMLIVAVAQSVLELICTYRLFASCDPQNKWLYFLLGIFLGVTSVFVFLCRNKDLGMTPPQPPVMGYMPPSQDQNPWGQN